jgi:predicted ATP-grasp superfamily ATP-dependent carboligase
VSARDRDRRSVVVTDGEQRAALATVRSLGRAGYDVYVSASRARSLAGASRYCAGSDRVADPLREPSNFVADVRRVVAKRRADLLLPVTEAALLAILPNRAQFNCVIPFADWRDFADICDKKTVLARAERRGIAVPRQVILNAAPDASQIRNELRFPVVLKPSRSVAGVEGDWVRAGVSYAPTADAFDRAVNSIPGKAYPVLVQQRISGPGFGISVLVWEGKLVAAFAHRRLREKPPTGGVSVLRESVALDRELLSRSLELLSDFNWRGVAMVEYKLDLASGVPYLMEINGRLWGSLQLAIDAGVDFPRLLAEAALGAAPAPVVDYALGVRSHWEWGDVDHLLASVLHRSRFRAALPDVAAPGAIKTIFDFLRSFAPGTRTEVFRLDDPAPILRETADWIRRR